jgi:hypothetical protein
MGLEPTTFCMAIVWTIRMNAWFCGFRLNPITGDYRRFRRYWSPNGPPSGRANVRGPDEAKSGVPVSLRGGRAEACVGAPVAASNQRQSPARRGELVGDGEFCGDERSAVGWALDPELPVEGGKPVGQPEQPAAAG